MGLEASLIVDIDVWKVSILIEIVVEEVEVKFVDQLLMQVFVGFEY